MAVFNRLRQDATANRLAFRSTPIWGYQSWLDPFNERKFWDNTSKIVGLTYPERWAYFVKEPKQCEWVETLTHYDSWNRPSSKGTPASGREFSLYPVYTTYGGPPAQWLQLLVTDFINTNPSLTELSFRRNNKFNVLVALKELDETIASFLDPRTFASYGGIEWGLKPLLSDLISLRDSALDILGGKIGNQLAVGQDTYVKRSVNKWLTSDGSIRFIGDVYARGRLSVVEMPDFSAFDTAVRLFADELGFHPDLSTVWDAVPLSFLIDRFLPIGDFLDDLHPRGWFKPEVLFKGSVMVKGTMEIWPTASTYSTNYGWRKDPGSFRVIKPSSAKVFLRVPTTVTSARKMKDPEWQAPKAKDIFNLGYIFGPKRAGKKAYNPALEGLIQSPFSPVSNWEDVSEKVSDLTQ